MTPKFYLGRAVEAGQLDEAGVCHGIVLACRPEDIKGFSLLYTDVAVIAQRDLKALLTNQPTTETTEGGDK